MRKRETGKRKTVKLVQIEKKNNESGGRRRRARKAIFLRAIHAGVHACRSPKRIRFRAQSHTKPLVTRECPSARRAGFCPKNTRHEHARALHENLSLSTDQHYSRRATSHSRVSSSRWEGLQGAAGVDDAAADSEGRDFLLGPGRPMERQSEL